MAVAAVQLADLVIHLEWHSLVCPIICLLQGGQDEERGGEHGKKETIVPAPHRTQNKEPYQRL